MTKTFLPIAVFMAMLTAALGIGQSAAAETSRTGLIWSQPAAQAAPAEGVRVQLAHWDWRKGAHRHGGHAKTQKKPGWHAAPRKSHRYGWYKGHRKPRRYGWYNGHHIPPRYGWYKGHRKPPHHGAYKPRRHAMPFFHYWGGHAHERR